jgi:hypothetical protein
MQLACRKCGRDIWAEDMNIDTLVAKCRCCNAVFSFAADLGDREAAAPTSLRTRSRARVPLPRGITAEDRGRSLLLTRRWFNSKVIFLVFFCVMWDGFLFTWFCAAFKEGAPPVMALLPLIHVLVGAVITYFTAASIVNTTVIEVERGTVSIRHGPLPWFGNRTIRSADLEQLYTEQRYHRTKHGGYYTYELSAVTRGGGRIKLLSSLVDPAQARYLEQEIERCLKIQDQPVVGEMVY